MVPVEVRRHVVGRDRKREHAALGVARHHHFDVGAVDHVHLRLQFAVGERHLLAADHRHLLAQVFGADPVEGQVGERRLRAPARGHVEVVDQLLDALPDGGVIEPVLADERRHVGVERRERLRAGPFVLQRAEEVDDLAHRAGQVFRRLRLDLAGHAVQALVQERAQRPAGAVAGEHVEVVDMNAAVAVRRADLGRIDVGEPVVGHHLAGDVEDQPAQRIALVGIGVDAPVLLIEVLVDRGGDVHQRLAVGAQLLVLFAVDDIGARGGDEVGGDQRLLDDVLDRLDVGGARGVAMRDHLERRVRHRPRLFGIELAAGGAGARDGRQDLAGIERLAAAVALQNFHRQRACQAGLQHRFLSHGNPP